MRSISFLLLFVMALSAASAQIVHPERSELFRDDIVSKIELTMTDADLAFVLDPTNQDSDELFSATMVFSNEQTIDTVEQVGFRLRGNTSRSAKKKSFKIDINHFVSGRTFYGVQKINLNGQHNDPTSARAKIAADLAEQMDIPSMRSNHVELHINGEYKGLYTNVEHIDQHYLQARWGNQNGNLYKCLYPANLDYKGDDPDLYKFQQFGRRPYDLKTNIEADDYSDFAAFVKILNLTSTADLQCEIEQVFNVDQYLRTIVFDILTGNWDGPIYNQNNFYLYHNEETDLLEYISFDLDNTLGIDWLNRDWGTRDIYSWSQTGQHRPIYNRLIAVPEYRARLTYYMQKVLLDLYNDDLLFPYLDQLRILIRPAILDDAYHRMDYGFDVEDFEDGFDVELPYFQTDYGIKEFVQTRAITAWSQLEADLVTAPILTQMTHNYPTPSESLNIGIAVQSARELTSIQVCYEINGAATTCLDMIDDGLGIDDDASDGIYSVSIPAIEAIADITWIVTATDSEGLTSAYPTCERSTITVESDNPTIVINELLADNKSISTDVRDEYDDWIELHNYGTERIYLGDKYLSDNTSKPGKWKLPKRYIEAEEYLVIWADDDASQGSLHASFKLSSGGETVMLSESVGSSFQTIDEVLFEDQVADISYGRLPDANGDFTHLIPTPGAINLEETSSTTGPTSILKISPNPALAYITVTTTDIFELQSVDIINAAGISQKITFNDNRIGIQHLAKGQYWLTVTLNDGSIKRTSFVKL